MFSERAALRRASASFSRETHTSHLSRLKFRQNTRFSRENDEFCSASSSSRSSSSSRAASTLSGSTDTARLCEKRRRRSLWSRKTSMVSLLVLLENQKQSDEFEQFFADLPHEVRALILQRIADGSNESARRVCRLWRRNVPPRYKVSDRNARDAARVAVCPNDSVHSQTVRIAFYGDLINLEYMCFGDRASSECSFSHLAENAKKIVRFLSAPPRCRRAHHTLLATRAQKSRFRATELRVAVPPHRHAKAGARNDR